jgi:hypothetical protein
MKETGKGILLGVGVFIVSGSLFKNERPLFHKLLGRGAERSARAHVLFSDHRCARSKPSRPRGTGVRDLDGIHARSGDRRGAAIWRQGRAGRRGGDQCGVPRPRLLLCRRPRRRT